MYYHRCVHAVPDISLSLLFCSIFTKHICSINYSTVRPPIQPTQITVCTLTNKHRCTYIYEFSHACRSPLTNSRAGVPQRMSNKKNLKINISILHLLVLRLSWEKELFYFLFKCTVDKHAIFFGKHLFMFIHNLCLVAVLPEHLILTSWTNRT